MRTPTALVVAVASLTLVGCSPTIDDPSPDGRGDHGVPGDVLMVEHGVLYYPACGNEVLWDGRAWYPFTPTNLDEFPADPIPAWADAAGAARANSDVAIRSAAYAPAVVAPGPGDDKGTLVTYDGGLAYWESNSGALSTWLTRDELQYGWEC